MNDVRRMAIPKPHSLIEVGCGLGCLTTLFGGASILAVRHLWSFRETIWIGVAAAIVWVAFLGFCFAAGVAGIREQGGFRLAAVTLVGCLAFRHFIETERKDDEGFVRLGFELLGRTWHVLETSSDSVVSVEWSAGQATGMTGRDCNDWHVWLWYHDPEIRRRVTGFPVREETLHQIGDEGPKDRMAELGRRVVVFLRESGIDLNPTLDPNVFTITGEPPIWRSPHSGKPEENI